MKEKYQGVIVFIVTGAVLLAGVAGEKLLADKLRGSVRITNPSVTPDFEVPDSAELAYMNFLGARLQYLAEAGFDSSRADLKLFGVEKKIGLDPVETLPVQAAPNVDDWPAEDIFSDYDLTLSFAAPTKRFCVINGILYKERATLPDGGRILKIENDRVLVLKQKKKNWIFPKNLKGLQGQNREQAI